MAVEIVGGFFSHSLALISDAGHMFTHFFALFISLSAIWCASKNCCHHRTFGFYRMEILAALFNSLFLFGVTIWIIVEGIKRIMHPVPVFGLEMFVIAFIGLVVNLVSILILEGASKDDINIKSAFLHMIADTVSSIAIVIGAVIIYFTNWDMLDPILSIGIAVMILRWGFYLFRDSVNILLEAAPKGIDTDQVKAALTSEIPSIKEITDMHIWEITSKMYSMTAHIRLKNDIERKDQIAVLNQIKDIVNNRFDIEHTTIELD